MLRCSESVMVTLLFSKSSLHTSLPLCPEASTTKGLLSCFTFQGSADRNLPDRMTNLSPLAWNFSGISTESSTFWETRQSWKDRMVYHPMSGSLLSPPPCTSLYSACLQGSRGERSVSIWPSSPLGTVSCKVHSEHCIYTLSPLWYHPATPETQSSCLTTYMYFKHTKGKTV